MNRPKGRSVREDVEAAMDEHRPLHTIRSLVAERFGEHRARRTGDHMTRVFGKDADADLERFEADLVKLVLDRIIEKCGRDGEKLERN